VSLCFADISTGTAALFVHHDMQDARRSLPNELSRYDPAELLVNNKAAAMTDVMEFVHNRMELHETLLPDVYFAPEEYEPLVLAQFSADDTKSLGIADGDEVSVSALCGLFYYIFDTQRSAVGRFTELKVYADKRFMELDVNARRNLELCETMRSKEKKGSLLWVLDHTKTSMGKRLLKAYTEQPLIKPNVIIDRLDSVEELSLDAVMLSELQTLLAGVYDLERLMTKVMYRTANPRDIRALAMTASQMPLIKSSLVGVKTSLLCTLRDSIDELSDISALVENAISDDPPVQLKDGGVIRDGFNEELDRIRDIIHNGKGVIKEIEQRERDKTGIKNLKIGYNHVFGYYIEVTRSYYDLVPAEYIRKQTLANSERFITEELKRTEEEMASASDRVVVLESEIFSEVRDFIASKLEHVQRTAQSVAALDVLCSFAEISLQNRYVKPDIAIDGVISIKAGRHPVVEQMIQSEAYVPNDVYLDQNENRMAIITGPNMAGKSTYMRQTALIVIMAQIGCFVPADSAHITLVDKIFTRVGASDDLSAGQSTFMVEMSEVADILKNATSQSLVILDEVGRGTSTFDGISIATAVAEHISNKKRIGCKTMFATHYHELIGLEERLDGVKNYSIAVQRSGDTIRFLRKIVRGGADDSYGIEVAKLAGLPNTVINRAKQILSEIETADSTPVRHEEKEQVSFASIAEDEVIRRLKMTSPDEYSPREALVLLQELYDSLMN
ncbi:MAG: DNA mismatch repair protein MutS, partial [Oscillospiraceae bacterium]|nr:DNA mismatch repair protein MutS [Oscillospiraceae bacterium]